MHGMAQFLVCKIQKLPKTRTSHDVAFTHMFTEDETCINMTQDLAVEASYYR